MLSSGVTSGLGKGCNEETDHSQWTVGGQKSAASIMPDWDLGKSLGRPLAGIFSGIPTSVNPIMEKEMNCQHSRLRW